MFDEADANNGQRVSGYYGIVTLQIPVDWYKMSFG